MLVAKIQNGKVIDIADMRSMFPNTSFPDSGPNDDWYEENGCMKINLSAPCDYLTQQLESCEPYIVDGVVYTNRAVPKSVIEEIIVTSSANDTITMGTASDTIS